jgi:hypothetical protein
MRSSRRSMRGKDVPSPSSRAALPCGAHRGDLSGAAAPAAGHPVAGVDQALSVQLLKWARVPFWRRSTERKGVDEQQVIAATGLERDLAEGDAAGGGGVEGPGSLGWPSPRYRGGRRFFSRVAASGFIGARSVRRGMTPSEPDAWGKGIGQARVRQSANRAEIREMSRLRRDLDPLGGPR